MMNRTQKNKEWLRIEVRTVRRQTVVIMSDSKTQREIETEEALENGTRDGRWQVDIYGRPVAGEYPCYVFDEEKLAMLREYCDVPSGRWSR
jgi:hypothetical protein